MSRLQRYQLFWLILIVTFAADQITKHWIHTRLDLIERIPVVDGFFWIVHVHNPGAAWGILSGHGWFLSTLALCALFAIYLYRKALEIKTTYMQVVFGLICSGILGNLIDRLRFGYVIDFLDFLLGSYHWPAFNIADSCIFSGVVLHLLYTFRHASAPDNSE
jgi:signal peptidase II